MDESRVTCKGATHTSGASSTAVPAAQTVYDICGYSIMVSVRAASDHHRPRSPELHGRGLRDGVVASLSPNSPAMQTPGTLGVGPRWRFGVVVGWMHPLNVALTIRLGVPRI